ncbi:hypothetical protein O181_081856 [Austropuccinia psidii MF-1]|uniref:Reverse transcriptase Ty1/copia-type domain-containing protein n=1 Tax=Austropuccinia psidii MF-1 TaxID=1389203 RepID=A0A9Q3IGC8_9BASI|nr:hypothetical protein [Austropuccinia psidii MF-1]
MDKEYLKRIGMLLYIAQGTRPNISYAVNYLARFSMGTTSAHWEALEHLIGYLRKTRNISLRISENEKPNALQYYINCTTMKNNDEYITKCTQYSVLRMYSTIRLGRKRKQTQLLSEVCNVVCLSALYSKGDQCINTITLARLVLLHAIHSDYISRTH